MVQNRTHNASKISTIFNMTKMILQDRLGAVLGRSWAILTGLGPSWGDLGAAGGAKIIDFPKEFQRFLKITILNKNCDLGQS